MRMPILEQPKFLDLEFWRCKLQEETKEVLLAKDIDNLLEEYLDVIQVCVGALEHLKNEFDIDISKELNKHEEKLNNRGWETKEVLEIKFIDENINDHICCGKPPF
ncbi:hypothetical protein [Clostridium sp. KNHs214]|uniref:hypothetical protein n=1 Tax=Clostridium sp. KNHs214 TaxID=1540257 RepID=UPI00068A7061|nr:hypothetical protein [Clostridium sp. KNHs214]